MAVSLLRLRSSLSSATCTSSAPTLTSPSLTSPRSMAAPTASCSSTSARCATSSSPPRAPPRPSCARTTTSSPRGRRTHFATSSYGKYWRQARRLVTTHLLSAKKVHSLRPGREEEVRLVIAKIQEARAAGAVVDMTVLLGAFTNDIACRAVSGKFCREEGRNRLFREVIDGNVATFGGFNLQDYFPSLGKVDVLTRVVFAKTKKLKKRWDELLDMIIDDHIARRSSSIHQYDEHDQHEHEPDFVDVLLNLQQEFNLRREHIKAILMGMFVAGTDTSYIALEFAMAELVRKPQLMSKLQAEVREKTPKDQQMVKEDVLSRMTYLKAVIKETLRLHPPVPLLLPHLSMAKCEVNGYTIPAETRVIVNAWALGRHRVMGESR